MHSRIQNFLALIPVTALIFLDQTILPVALPTIQQAMQADATALQWSVNAYLLAIAVFVLLCGKWGDRIGHKQVLLGGMLGFVFSSALCGWSETIEFFIAARFCQGISAAMMLPAQTAMISLLFSPKKRGRAIGMLVSIGSLFLILGPLIGGYLIQVASWPWIFWINIPLGLLGLWTGYVFLPSSTPVQRKIDGRSFLLFALGVCALTLVLMQVVDWGWISEKTFWASLAGACFFGLLWHRERKSAGSSFLELSLFRLPIYAMANMNIFITQFFLMITVFRAVYFQEILGYTPFFAGAILFFSSLPILFTAPIAGYLSDRISPRLPIAIGYLFLIFSSFYFFFSSLPSPISLTIVLFIFSAGIPLILTPSISAAITAVGSTKVGVGMGMITTLRMIGGTLGLALIHLLTSVFREHFAFEGDYLAQVKSFSYVHLVLAFLLTLTFALTFIFYSRPSAHRLPEAPAEGWD